MTALRTRTKLSDAYITRLQAMQIALPPNQIANLELPAIDYLIRVAQDTLHLLEGRQKALIVIEDQKDWADRLADKISETDGCRIANKVILADMIRESLPSVDAQIGKSSDVPRTVPRRVADEETEEAPTP